MQTPTEIAFEFVKGINGHDVERLCELMSDDHTFINSLGSRLQGCDKVRAAWANYFEMFPDYSMHCTEIFERGLVVAMFGRAQASYRNQETGGETSKWEMPAAWKAVMRQDRLHVWQIFADNEPIRQQLAGTSTARRLSKIRGGIGRRRPLEPHSPSR